ncbi:MAG TPA: TlpA disulfide reductase family protein [Candidatus Limnocylindrales bacterium]|nr:TlpA disulfide reductase family protein [Candidatus Limnocylindrales bacterium]
MIQRVEFVLGAASLLAALPLTARGDEPPAAPVEPDEEPSASPAPGAQKSPAPKPRPSKKPHVHGPNGVVTLPEHRPIEWSLEVLDGPPFRLSAYRGKVVFVNVFATWCPPCRLEQPAVVAFAGEHPDDTVVIGIDVDEEDNKVRDYRKKFGIPYPIAMDRYDKIVRRVYREGRMVFPTTIVFKPDGTLSCAWAGDATQAWFEYERKVALGLAN